MINKEHIRQFKKCKKLKISDKDIYDLKEDINFFLPTIKALIQHGDIESPNELRAEICSFVNFIIDNSIQSNYIGSRLYEIHAIDALIKNPNTITKEYPNIKNIPNNPSLYNANDNRSQRLALSTAVDHINKLMDFAKTYGITKNTNINNVVINVENVEEIKKIIKLSIQLLGMNTEKDKILLMLREQKKDCEVFLKQTLISSISSLHEFFSAFNLLDSYLASYKLNCSKFGFPELDYDLSTGKYDKNSIGINEFFSKEFLNSIPLNELCFINAFWYNRFSKESARMFSAFSAIDSLDLWNDIFKGKTNFKISDDSLIAASQKSAFISKLLKETFNMYQNSKTTKELQDGIDIDVPTTKDFADYYSQLQSYIGNDYTEYFSEHLESDNNLLQDFAFSAPFINLEQCAYTQKDDSILPLIKTMLDTHGFKNWGLIRNELINGTLVDSISENKRKLLIQFDVEGYNMPLRFHVNKDDLLDLLKLSTPSYMIPEYQGADDFIINNELVPTNIIMPIPSRHKQTIMNMAKQEISNNNLWQHFYLLMNGKLPKHFTQTVRKNRKETIEERLPIIYTDIRTGKRYSKIKNKYIEVDGYAR